MPFPNDVGIIAMECIFPSQFVDQSELEVFDEVSTGKYTIGLGQSKMGFCTDREDINSLCLTAVSSLMEKYAIDYNTIGRLEVGTETIVDKSKSVKSVLMQLFEESGNLDVEGVDTTNACYGGTAALFNSVAWIESSAWDGRYAVVVMGDIAVYSKGNARPTGGAGAIAMLIGPNAPLILDQGNRASYMRHAYDFYKPNLSSEYPVVDGKLSIQCYLSALDNCYKLFCKKSSTKLLHGDGNQGKFTLNNLDAVLFHSPYCKLVQKSLARLLFNDFIQASESEIGQYPGLESFHNIVLEETYFNRDIEQASIQLSKTSFEAKTKPSLLLANQVGNMYTPSLYGGLVSLLISKTPSQLVGKRVALFAYGSGLASSMFSLLISDKCNHESLTKLCSCLSDINKRLSSRTKFSPEQFVQIMESKESTHLLAPYQPKSSPDILFPGTWFLMSVDAMYRRAYDRTPLTNISNRIPSPLAQT